MAQKMPAYMQEQLTLIADCIACLKSDDPRCATCQEEHEDTLAIRAYELVDEGNMQYPRPWLQTTEPTGHDWIGSVVRLPDGREREEFLEPIVKMEDRYFDTDLDIENKETVCASCHLVCWALLPCPNCEEVNP